MRCRHTGLPRHIWMNRSACWNAVILLRSIEASPHTDIALTQLNRQSMYATGYLPLAPYWIPENMRGVNVLKLRG